MKNDAESIQKDFSSEGLVNLIKELEQEEHNNVNDK